MMSKNSDAEDISLFKPEKYLNYEVNSKLSLNGRQLYQYYEQFECSVCYNISGRPVRCKQCKHIYCPDCVASQKKISPKCAFRCGSDFSIQRCNEFIPTYICPFKKCRKQLLTDQQFLNHYKECGYFKASQRDLLRNRAQFKCRKGLHALEFYVDTFMMMTSFDCDICHQKGVRRAICRQCDEIYCINCRPVPFCHKKCPIGHDFIPRNMTQMTYLCDLCSLPSAAISSQMYDDRACNLGLCALCYEQLKNQETPVEILRNEPEYCRNSSSLLDNRNEHILSILKSAKPSLCKICFSLKFCYQNCKTCSQSYCLKCKPILICGGKYNPMCKSKHRIQEKPSRNHILFCDRCEKEINSKEKSYEDQGCQINLCEACFNHGRILQNTRMSLSQHYVCPKNHFISYHSSYIDYEIKCALCSEVKKLKFYCHNCNQKHYCASCFKHLLAPGKCFLGHELQRFEGEKLENLMTEFKKQISKTCHFCSNQINKQLHRCFICNLNVCSNCYSSLKKTL